MLRNKNLKLSVVVPCYDEMDTILGCLNGLRSQGELISEIIVVDNNSSDKTLEIVKEFATKNAKIKILKEKKQGVQFARNTGLNAATGEIIARIDADTIVEKNWAKELIKFYSNPANENVGAASGYSWYYDLPFPKISHFLTNLFTHEANQKLARSHTIYGSNMTIRRRAWQKVKNEVCMNFGIMEDQDLGFHVTSHGYTTAFVPSAKARVSGRRMRMSPLRYWRYNGQWWQTYANHGEKIEARKIRSVVWIGNISQAIVWAGLLFHDPTTGKFSPRNIFSERKERLIP